MGRPSRTLQNYLYSYSSMAEVFSDENTMSQWIRVEAALAKVQSRLGIIPEWAAGEINRNADIDSFDMARIAEGKLVTGHPFVPVINEFVRICSNGAGEYVHWGATTQDIMDTGLMLQIHKALGILRGSTQRLALQFASLAEKHRHTLTIGRTNGQYALPMTLGAKLIRWVAELDRMSAQILRLSNDARIGQFSGAVGTLASLGDDGPLIRDGLLAELNLRVPDTPWHSNRDYLSGVVQALGMVSEVVENIAETFFTLLRPEISEVREHPSEGSVGSSTMPQKRNPFGVMEASGLARLARGTAAQWVTMSPIAEERDAKTLLLEAELLPRIFMESDAAVMRLVTTLQDLEFDTSVMNSRASSTEGMILAERVMMRLADEIGRHNAHQMVHRFADRAYNQKVSFETLVRSDKQVQQYLSRSDLDMIFNPATYTGQSVITVDEYLARRADQT